MVVWRLFFAIFLNWILRSNAVDLLRPTAASGVLPSGPTVKCWCAGLPKQTFCSWAEPPHHLPTQYIASYRERHRWSVTKQCSILLSNSSSPIANSTASPSARQLWYCHLEDLKLLTDYIFNLTAITPLGNSSDLTSFMMEDIVKPDPPADVQVSLVGFRKLSVKWSPPPTWSNLHIFPLKYQIRYQWENRGIKETLHLGPYESSTVDLRGLLPGQLQVCAMELLGLGECSQWSAPVTVPMTMP